MPTYGYKCDRCEISVDRFMTVSQMESAVAYCPVCAEEMEWDPSPGYKKTPFKQFTTNHVTGKPMLVDSMRTLRKIEKEHNVNFPAYGDSMLGGNIGQNETTWTDPSGRNHYE